MPSNTPSASSPAPVDPAVYRHLRIGRWRFSAMELLGALVLLIVLAPFVQSLPNGRMIESGVMTLVLIAAVLAIGGRRRTLLISVLLAAPAAAARWLHHFRPDLSPAGAYPAAAIIFIAFVIVRLLTFVLRAPRVDAEVLCASISAYLLLGLLWAFGYSVAAAIDPGAFVFNTADANGAKGSVMDGFNAFYFSFVTLSTVGFGDITPASPVARMLAVTEAIAGLLYVAVLIARLVALYSAPESSAPTDQQ